MPVSYPGVYLQEVPSGVQAIPGVSTSTAAFVGAAPRGLPDTPVRIASFGDYVRHFGGLSHDSPMSYAVSHFFLNGGSDAVVVRVAREATSAVIALPADGEVLRLEARSPGAWGDRVSVSVTPSEAAPGAFTVIVEEAGTGGAVTVSETFADLTIERGHPRHVGAVLAAESALVTMIGDAPSAAPDETPAPQRLGGGSDGEPITDADLCGPGTEERRRGLYALDGVDLFNLLVVPPLRRDGEVGSATHDAALAYARRRRAVYLADAPDSWSKSANPVAAAEAGIDALIERLDNGALYFPRIMTPDPLQENRLAPFAPAGAVAGVIARTDAQRGVWKAPAGTEATLVGVPGLTVALNDADCARLNRIGIDCLRRFPGIGTAVWGARTLHGSDTTADEWKYLPVRRTAYYIEESLYRGLRWAVFEPNDEPLWAQIRLAVGTFMAGLFRQGTFQGSSASEAYFVKCDATTTTQSNIDRGIVRAVIGFAPLRPAEFVVIAIEQPAGQSAS